MVHAPFVKRVHAVLKTDNSLTKLLYNKNKAVLIFESFSILISGFALLSIFGAQTVRPREILVCRRPLLAHLHHHICHITHTQS